MPRVHVKTKNRGGKHVYRCRGCGEDIQPGERYYQWEKRYGGPQRRHIACGYPRPTELSNRKTAQVEEAVQDAQGEIGGWTWEPGEGDDQVDTSDLLSILEQVADSADEVADEYESSADSMPENLQYGAQAEAMRDVADRLREWADTVRSFEPSDPYLDAEAEDPESALADLLDTIRSEAEGVLDDMPEYEG